MVQEDRTEQIDLEKKANKRSIKDASLLLFINVNKSYDFENLQKNQIEDLIRERIQKDKDKLIHDWKEVGIRVEKARWGRSVIIKGKKRIQLSKDIDPQKLTKEDAEGYLGKKSKK